MTLILLLLKVKQDTGQNITKDVAISCQMIIFLESLKG